MWEAYKGSDWTKDWFERNLFAGVAMCHLFHPRSQQQMLMETFQELSVDWGDLFIHQHYCSWFHLKDYFFTQLQLQLQFKGSSHHKNVIWPTRAIQLSYWHGSHVYFCPRYTG